MKIDSIIFDLDGTLWDSSEGVVKSWNEGISKYDDIEIRVTVDDLKGVMGLQIDEIAKRFFPQLTDEMRKKLITECCDIENKYLEEHGGILYNELEATLEQLSKKYKLFIVSNCQAGYIECFLKAHKLEKYFIDFECPGRTGLPKSENIKLVVQRNNLINPIYVGDTNGDFKAAKSANVPFVYARYGFGDVDETECYYIIDEFKQLLNTKLDN